MLRIIWAPKFLPSLLIAIDVLAAVRWTVERNPGQVVYWISAATLTYAVTYMMVR